MAGQGPAKGATIMAEKVVKYVAGFLLLPIIPLLTWMSFVWGWLLHVCSVCCEFLAREVGVLPTDNLA